MSSFSSLSSFGTYEPSDAILAAMKAHSSVSCSSGRLRHCCANFRNWACEFWIPLEARVGVKNMVHGGPASPATPPRPAQLSRVSLVSVTGTEVAGMDEGPKLETYEWFKHQAPEKHCAFPSKRSRTWASQVWLSERSTGICTRWRDVNSQYFGGPKQELPLRLPSDSMEDYEKLCLDLMCF